MVKFLLEPDKKDRKERKYLSQCSELQIQPNREEQRRRRATKCPGGKKVAKMSG
jgi:hypothetical protein